MLTAVTGAVEIAGATAPGGARLAEFVGAAAGETAGVAACEGVDCNVA